MTREVHLLQACLLAVNGQNTLVHQEKGIIITVSVKCHSGKNLGNGIYDGHHPKIQHIHLEAIAKKGQVRGRGEGSLINLVKELIIPQRDIGIIEMKRRMTEQDQNIRRLHTKMDNHYKTWTYLQIGVHPSQRIHMEPEKRIQRFGITLKTMQSLRSSYSTTQIKRAGHCSRRRYRGLWRHLHR